MMKKMVEMGKKDPRIYALAGQILWKAGVKGKDQPNEIRSIVTWSTDNIAYRRDINNVETFADPWFTILYHRGDCDDFSITLCSLLECLGYKTQFRVIETKNSTGGWNHVYALVEYPRGSGKYVPIDATMPEMGDHGLGWEAPASMVRRKLDYPLNGLEGVTMPLQEGISYHSDPNDWNEDTFYDHPESWGMQGLDYSWSDFTKDLSKLVKKIESTATTVGKDIRSLGVKINDLIPANIRNSPAGQYLTREREKIAKIVNAIGALANPDMIELVGYASIGKWDKAIDMATKKKDTIIAALPAKDRAYINGLYNNLVMDLDPQGGGLHGFGVVHDQFGYVSLGELSGSMSTMDQKIRRSWDQLPHKTKNKIILGLIVIIIITIVVAYFASGSLPNWLTEAGKWIANRWTDLKNYLKPMDVIKFLGNWIMGIFKGKGTSFPAVNDQGAVLNPDPAATGATTGTTEAGMFGGSIAGIPLWAIWIAAGVGMYYVYGEKK